MELLDKVGRRRVCQHIHLQACVCPTCFAQLCFAVWQIMDG